MSLNFRRLRLCLRKVCYNVFWIMKHGENAAEGPAAEGRTPIKAHGMSKSSFADLAEKFLAEYAFRVLSHREEKRCHCKSHEVQVTTDSLLHAYNNLLKRCNTSTHPANDSVIGVPELFKAKINNPVAKLAMSCFIPEKDAQSFASRFVTKQVKKWQKLRLSATVPEIMCRICESKVKANQMIVPFFASQDRNTPSSVSRSLKRRSCSRHWTRAC